MAFAALVAIPVDAASPPEQDPVVLAESFTSIRLEGHMKLLEDPEGTLGFDDVSTGPATSRFEAVPDGRTDLGFTTSAFWVRWTLVNTAAEPRRLFLEVDDAILDEITFYTADASGQYSFLTLGDNLPFGARPIANRNPVFDFVVPASSTRTYYARLHTEGSMSLALVLYDPDTFYAVDHDGQIVLGVYFGVVLVMGLYNLFLFFAIRDRAYVYYVLLIAAVALFNAGITGLAYEYVLQYVGVSFFVHRSLLFFVVMIGGAGCLFAMSFLRTRETAPRLHRLLNLFALLFALLFVAILVGPYGPVAEVCSVMTVSWCFVLAGTGVWLLVKGYRPARFFVLAWTALLIGCALQAARLLGLLPTTFVTMYGMEIGSAVDVVFLSFALADRISIMREEKEEAHRDAVEAARRESQANEEKAKAQEAAIASLKQADRLKDEFLANMSHELRTPLNAILGFSGILKKRLEGQIDPRLTGFLEKIDHSGQHLVKVIDDIMDVTLLASGELEVDPAPTDLEKLATEVIAGMSREASEKGIALVGAIAPGLPPAKIDEKWAKQILLKLVGNAVKFTEAGKVEVRGEEVVDQRELGIGGPAVAISIVDTGVGIPRDCLERIFQPFQQADGSCARRFEGAGLGLAIARQAAELHGGRISVESEVGVGTRFTVTLPRA